MLGMALSPKQAARIRGVGLQAINGGASTCKLQLPSFITSSTKQDTRPAHRLALGLSASFFDFDARSLSRLIDAAAWQAAWRIGHSNNGSDLPSSWLLLSLLRCQTATTATHTHYSPPLPALPR